MRSQICDRAQALDCMRFLFFRCQTQICQYVRSLYEDYTDALVYNDRWEAELQSLTLQETIELFETPHYRLFSLSSSLKPEQWNGYVRAWVRGSTWHHFEEHGEQIRAWVAGRGQTNQYPDRATARVRPYYGRGLASRFVAQYGRTLEVALLRPPPNSRYLLRKLGVELALTLNVLSSRSQLSAHYQ